MQKDSIKFIAFDADDTLWENELYFHEFEDEFCKLLSSYLPAPSVSQELFQTEMKNLHLYGYGLKGMILSMIETICRITNGKGSTDCVNQVIRLGQELLQKPIKLLDGVETVLTQLQGKYELILATKGDLLEQRRKIEVSGIQQYFRHTEIMSDKKVSDYQKLLGSLDCQPMNFLMIGNSIKSDIVPILELGGYAAHIPHHITWEHEHYEGEVNHPNFIQLSKIQEILDYLL